MSKKTVLIVDDEVDIRETLREALELYGFPAVSASNGREALEVLAATKDIGLVLLDLMMPVMDGNQFLEIRRNSQELRKIPVVIVTANSENGLKKMQAGAEGFLKKPIELQELIDAIEFHQLRAPCQAL